MSIDSTFLFLQNMCMHKHTSSSMTRTLTSSIPSTVSSISSFPVIICRQHTISSSISSHTDRSLHVHASYPYYLFTIPSIPVIKGHCMVLLHPLFPHDTLIISSYHVHTHIISIIFYH